MSVPVKRISAQINRLRVFNAAKRFMEQHARSPEPHELADTVSLSPTSIREHLSALNGADGLPFSTVTGRSGADVARDNGHGESPGRLDKALAVDEVIGGDGGMFRLAGYSRREIFKDVGGD